MSENDKAVRLDVSFLIDASTFRDVEKMLDAWLASAEDDDRLISYSVAFAWGCKP